MASLSAFETCVLFPVPRISTFVEPRTALSATREYAFVAHSALATRGRRILCALDFSGRGGWFSGAAVVPSTRDACPCGFWSP